MAKIDVAGLKIDYLSKQNMLRQISDRLESNRKTLIITPYSEFLYHSLEDNRLLEIFNRADFAVPDGIGILWANKYLSIPLTFKSYTGKILQAFWQIIYSSAAILINPKFVYGSLSEKIPGSELIWDLAKLAAEEKKSVYLLGGFGDTPKIVAEKLKALHPTLIISGYSNKNFNDPSVVQDIKNTNPDFLFVAFGPIKQEQWIVDHMDELACKVYIGLGGTFDYIAGKQTEPPSWIRSMGLEWLYRLITQPKRIKRIKNATFGLMNMLWHYKVYSSYPLRENAAAVILNKKNEVFVGRKQGSRVDIIKNKDPRKWQNYWQLPQGGIKVDEDLIEAAKREVAEETGIKSLQLIKISNSTNTYIWNNALRKFWNNRNYAFRGQHQRIVYFRFTGSDKEIQLPRNEEFIEYQWVRLEDLDKIIHPERAALTKIVQEDLKTMSQKIIFF